MTKIVMTIILNDERESPAGLLADAIANNILYNDSFDSDGVQRFEHKPEIAEISWELSDV